jgi:hypothetical protein
MMNLINFFLLSLVCGAAMLFIYAMSIDSFPGAIVSAGAWLVVMAAIVFKEYE